MIPKEHRPAFMEALKASIQSGEHKDKVFLEKMRQLPGHDLVSLWDVKNRRRHLAAKDGAPQARIGRPKKDKNAPVIKQSRDSAAGASASPESRIEEMRAIAKELRSRSAVFLKHAEFMEREAARMEAILEGVERVKTDIGEISSLRITELDTNVGGKA